VIRLSVLYPKTEGATFDHDYYRDRHVPFVQGIWAPESAEIDQGIDGPYEAAVHMRFASMEAMQAALMSERTGEVQADVANYTTITPVLQISQIV
jgi:uncharacterized protein (TIGR02118 family)